MLTLTVTPSIGMAPTCRAHPGSAAPSSKARVTRGSALETTFGAWIRSPETSSTPSPGTIRATGTSVAITAPASRAMSQSRNDTMPIPPSTYPQVPGIPSIRPEAWW